MTGSGTLVLQEVGRSGGTKAPLPKCKALFGRYEGSPVIDRAYPADLSRGARQTQLG